jgi:Zn-dependent protease/CBS domain-containing protein
VGRFFGVPLYFAPSWVLIAALITASYAGIIYDTVNGISRGLSYLIAFGYAVLLALCVLAHELGHTAVSLARGTPVRRVVIFLLGGVSELDEDIDRAGDEFLIAVAGPLVSAAIAGAAAIGHMFLPPDSVGWVLLVLLMWSNIVVAAFNLLPGLPLDGGRLLRAAVWKLARSKLTGTRVAAWAGRGIAVLVAAAAVLLNGEDRQVGTGLLGIALAAFIWIGATQSLRLGELAERVPGLTARALLRPGLFVPADMSVAEALRRTWESHARGLVIVDSADRPRAIVDEFRIRAVPFERRAWVSVSDVARPLEPGMILPADLSGEQLMSAIRATPAREYLVVEPDGSPAGILSATDLAARLSGQVRQPTAHSAV